jgi:heme-degrading monooxygenase HmoA
MTIGEHVIVREWRGRASRDRAAAYPRHFRERVLPELATIPGFLGAELLKRDYEGLVEFTVLTRWASLAAIASFAGSDPTKAVVEPGAIAALSDYDHRVTHHELLQHVDGGSRGGEPS